MEDISHTSQSVFQEVTDPAEARRALEDTVKLGAPVAVKPDVAAVGDKPQTSIFKLTGFTDFELTLTKLSGPELETQQKVAIMVGLESMKYFALGQVIGQSGQQIRISLGRLHKLQRRDTFRVTIDPKIIKAQFQTKHVASSAVQTTLDIIDLSVGGIGLSLPQNLYESLHAGDVLIGKITIGNYPAIEVQAQIRHKRQTRKSSKDFLNQAGCSFIAMPQGTADRVSFLVNDCHRQIFMKGQKL